MPSVTETTSTDSTNTDPLSQAILVLDKKQRNLGKRKVNFLEENFRLNFDCLGKVRRLSRRSKKWKRIKQRSKRGISEIFGCSWTN
jgi:hypothetical protein